jgi:hypothetical protein
MKALISPNELVYSYNGGLLGSRVAQVSETEFAVAEPLFWIDCTNDCIADQWYYSEGQLYIKPVRPEPEPEEPTV